VLEGRELASMDAVYDALAGQLQLGPEFGRNLDAVWDVLTTDVGGPIDIVWRDGQLSRARLGVEFDRMVRLLRAVAEQRDDVTVTVEG
jgi:ribonuclease inhibitor